MLENNTKSCCYFKEIDNALNNKTFRGFSIFQKPMQCLGRKHPTRVDHRDGSLRYEYEYIRRGTHTLLGAFDIKTGEVFGRVVEHRDAATVVTFVDELVRSHEGKDVYIVWDNLNIHHDGPSQRWTQLNAHAWRPHSFCLYP